jgi:hypothetical protein
VQLFDELLKVKLHLSLFSYRDGVPRTFTDFAHVQSDSIVVCEAVKVVRHTSDETATVSAWLLHWG